MKTSKVEDIVIQPEETDSPEVEAAIARLRGEARDRAQAAAAMTATANAAVAGMERALVYRKAKPLRFRKLPDFMQRLLFAVEKVGEHSVGGQTLLILFDVMKADTSDWPVPRCFEPEPEWVR